MDKTVKAPPMVTGLKQGPYTDTAAIIGNFDTARAQRLIQEMTAAAKTERLSPVHVMDMVYGMIEGHAKRAQILRPDGKVAAVFAEELAKERGVSYDVALQESQGYFAQRMRAQLETVVVLDPKGPLVQKMLEIVERERVQQNLADQKISDTMQKPSQVAVTLRPANENKPQPKTCKLCDVVSSLNPLKAI